MTALGVLQFRVAGLPVTQGSATAFVVGRRAIVTDSKRKTLKPWREAIRSTAVKAIGEAWQPMAGPVRVDLWLALPKPSSAPKRRRTWPIGARAGDVDKLARACLDALTDAGVWRDDSQVVHLLVVKDYPEHLQQMSPGALIRVRPVQETSALPSSGEIPLLTQADERTTT